MVLSMRPSRQAIGGGIVVSRSKRFRRRRQVHAPRYGYGAGGEPPAQPRELPSSFANPDRLRSQPERKHAGIADDSRTSPEQVICISPDTRAHGADRDAAPRRD